MFDVEMSIHKLGGYTKEDVVTMLTDIQLEIEETEMKYLTEKEIWNNAIGVCSSLVQQKIDSLKGANNE
jgi:hypothetical protein